MLRSRAGRGAWVVGGAAPAPRRRCSISRGICYHSSRSRRSLATLLTVATHSVVGSSRRLVARFLMARCTTAPASSVQGGVHTCRVARTADSANVFASALSSSDANTTAPGDEGARGAAEMEAFCTSACLPRLGGRVSSFASSHMPISPHALARDRDARVCGRTRAQRRGRGRLTTAPRRL